MNTHKRLLIGAVAVAAIVACQHPSTTPSGTGPTAPPAATPSPVGRGGTPGGGAPRPRPPRFTPDSLAKLRRNMVNQVLLTIAGRENEPAGTVFKNVQYSKDMPAGQFLNMMDSSYGRSLGWQCSNCHVTSDFASDAKKDKALAKLMIVMTNLINKDHIPKLHPDKPEKATCMMCHRGTNEPKDTVETYRTVVRPAS